MEGTHCTLQLRKPVTELCYISFYLPRGDVRGFSYKGTVTLDRSSKGFHNCYQVREGSDIISLSLQPNEHPGDIFFKETPTKDILTELYKLTAERDRLLANLLSSDHILGITMGNQDGKLPELSVSLAPEDDCFQSASNWQGEPPVGCLNKRSTRGNKKPRRFGGRRESSEVLPQKRTRRKGCGAQESAPQAGKDQIRSSDSLPLSREKPNLCLLEESGNLLPSRPLTHSLQRRESWPPEIPGTLDPDPGCESFGTASEDIELRRGGLAPDCGSTEPGDAGAGGLLRVPPSLAHQQTGLSESHEEPVTHPDAERSRRVKSAQWTRRKKPVSKVVAKVQDLSAQVQRVVKTHPEGAGRVAVSPAAHTGSVPSIDVLPAAEDTEQREDRPLQSSARERPPAVADGAVNKALLKVIESEKLDEATEGKRLGFPLSTAATRTLPDARRKRVAKPPLSGQKTLFVGQPPGVGPDSLQPGGDEKRLSPAALAALGMVLNNSSSQSGTHKRMSPVPSPPSPKLPSPQQHHRILRLPGEREATLDDSPGRKSGASSGPPSAATLEPSSSAKVTETKGASSAFLRADQPRLVPGEPSGKSLGPGKTTAWPQHPLPQG